MNRGFALAPTLAAPVATAANPISGSNRARAVRTHGYLQDYSEARIYASATRTQQAFDAETRFSRQSLADQPVTYALSALLAVYLLTAVLLEIDFLLTCRRTARCAHAPRRAGPLIAKSGALVPRAPGGGVLLSDSL